MSRQRNMRECAGGAVRRGWGAVSVWAVLALAPLASAGGFGGAFGRGAGGGQVPAIPEFRPPPVGDLGDSGVFLTYLVGGVLALAAVGVTIMPSQRTHQD